MTSARRTRDRSRDTRDRFPRQRFDLRRRFDPSPFPAQFDTVALVASSRRAAAHAVTLQGWNEGPGGGFRAPFLSLTTDDDPVAGPWSARPTARLWRAAGGRNSWA